MSQPMSDVDIRFDAPLEVDRWRVIGNLILAIPHFVVLYVLNVVANVAWIIAAFAVLFTKAVPPGLAGFLAMVQRYSWRLTTFAPFLHNRYPPFAFDTTLADPGTYPPATYSAPELTEVPRWAPLYRWIVIIPALIVLALFGIVAWVMAVISFFQVLFTGSWSVSMRDFIVKVGRQGARINAYLFLLTNQFPPYVPE